VKKDYMARLEQAARWRLPREEAEDVIADYRDIVGSPPRSEEELHREVAAGEYRPDPMAIAGRMLLLVEE